MAIEPKQNDALAHWLERFRLVSRSSTASNIEPWDVGGFLLALRRWAEEVCLEARAVSDQVPMDDLHDEAHQERLRRGSNYEKKHFFAEIFLYTRNVSSRRS